jgi:hypothetical protein
MLTGYTLSYRDKAWEDGERVSIYQWVRVGRNQVKPGGTFVYALPEDTPGEIVSYNVPGEGRKAFKVMTNNMLRELSQKEIARATVKLPDLNNEETIEDKTGKIHLG